MSFLISGSLVHDYIMDFPDRFKDHILADQIHILNVCFVAHRLQRSWGGTAGNIAYAVKMLGGEPLLVSALGKDGEPYRDHLKRVGISTEYISTDTTQLSASAHIITDADDNQITGFFGGPLASIDDQDLERALPLATLALLSPNPKPIMIKHARRFAEKQIPMIFDAGQQITTFDPEELWGMIDRSAFVIGNDYEVKLMQEKTGWTIDAFVAHAKTLITTLGSEGSRIQTSGGEEIQVRSCPPKSLEDPTGAGDAFRGGFFVGYGRGHDLKTCAQMGSVSASYAIETYGTQEYRFTPEEFCERYQTAYGEELEI